MSALLVSLLFLCNAQAHRDEVAECLSASPTVNWDYIDDLGLTSTSIPQIRGVRENLSICYSMAYADAVAKQESMLSARGTNSVRYHRAVRIWSKALHRDLAIERVLEDIDCWLETRNEGWRNFLRRDIEQMW